MEQKASKASKGSQPSMSDMSKSQLGFNKINAGSNRSSHRNNSSEIIQIRNIRAQCAKERSDNKHIQSVVQQEINETNQVIESVKSVQEAL